MAKGNTSHVHTRALIDGEWMWIRMADMSTLYYADELWADFDFEDNDIMDIDEFLWRVEHVWK